MTKLSRKERVRLTYKIEDVLARYCRQCPYDMNAVTREQCMICPVGWELREAGRVLKGSGAGSGNVPTNRTPWSDEETDELLKLRDKGFTYEKISVLMGRGAASVYKRATKIGETKIKR